MIHNFVNLERFASAKHNVEKETPATPSAIGVLGGTFTKPTSAQMSDYKAPLENGDLENWFKPFREQVIGFQKGFVSPIGTKPIIYADWVASGRLYAPIEQRITDLFGPFVGNTHTDSNVTGNTMTQAYQEAHRIIKEHCNARASDVIITCDTGMTGVINKLQRILGLRVPEKYHKFLKIPYAERPVVFLTHMEHHSNQTSWLECLCDVVVLEPDDRGFVNPDELRKLLPFYSERKYKIGAFTAASNVTGIETPLRTLARIMHEHGGLCFADYAMAAPYVEIDMHPPDPMEKLDAIYFSPHKFLGGPGSCGVLIFDANLYENQVPDTVGGGTVSWTNPWGGHKYFDDIEAREDGGTPGFLQTIRAAMAIRLKEAMRIDYIRAREKELVQMVFDKLSKVPTVKILAPNMRTRLGAISFYIENLHYNLVVKMLNDRYGIQVRGGCSCAGTYGHYLLSVVPDLSKNITDKIDAGDLSEKPGWVRLSVHPVMSNQEIEYICRAIAEVAQHANRWAKDYYYDAKKNEFLHNEEVSQDMEKWFEVHIITERKRIGLQKI